MNGDVVARFNFCSKSHHIPIRQTNATVACGVANRTRIVGAVNANAFFVECNPHDADWISRAWREQMKIAAALAVLEHLLVPTKSGQLCDPAHLPFTDG